MTRAFVDSQRSNNNLLVSLHDDLPSLTDGQLSPLSAMHAPHVKPTMRSFSRLEDSSTQTQVEDNFFSESKDAQVCQLCRFAGTVESWRIPVQIQCHPLQIQLTSADLRHETDSSVRRRKTRRRASRRSLTDGKPPPNDEELRWKSRQRNSYPNDSDLLYSNSDEEQSYGRRFREYQSDYIQSMGDYTNYESFDVNAAEKSDAIIQIVHVETAKERDGDDDNDNRGGSMLSTLGTESSGQKDSGFSDVLVNRVWECEAFSVSEEDPAQMTDGQRSRTSLAKKLEQKQVAAKTESRFVEGSPIGMDEKTDQLNRMEKGSTVQLAQSSNVRESRPDDDQSTSGHSKTSDRAHQLFPDSPSPRLVNKPSERDAVVYHEDPAEVSTVQDQSAKRTGVLTRSFRKPSRQSDDELSKTTFHLRRSKSERASRNSIAVVDDDGHLKSDQPSSMSLTRALQMKTRRSVCFARLFKQICSATRVLAEHISNRYQLEKKIFQQLLDLKQMQIRSGQVNEQVFAKRLIESFRKDSVTVGLRPYDGAYSFLELETYLYSKLRCDWFGMFVSRGSRVYQDLNLPIWKRIFHLFRDFLFGGDLT